MLDCEKENIGEQAVKTYFQKEGIKYIDVSKDPSYYEDDIDLLLVNEDGTTTPIEIKYDNYIHTYHSFFIELLSNAEKNKLGYIYQTKATYIYYVDPVNLDCYIFRPDEMRQYLKDNSYDTRQSKKDGYKTSLGAIIPIGYYWLDYDINKINLYQTKGIDKQYQKC